MLKIVCDLEALSMSVLLFVCMPLWSYVVIIPYQETNRLSVLWLSCPFGGGSNSWKLKLSQWLIHISPGLGRLRWEFAGVEGCPGLMSQNKGEDCRPFTGPSLQVPQYPCATQNALRVGIKYEAGFGVVRWSTAPSPPPLITYLHSHKIRIICTFPWFCNKVSSRGLSSLPLRLFPQYLSLMSESLIDTW